MSRAHGCGLAVLRLAALIRVSLCLPRCPSSFGCIRVSMLSSLVFFGALHRVWVLNLSVRAAQVLYAGDNFVRKTGDVLQVQGLQSFVWEAAEKGGNEDLTLESNPSAVELMYKEYQKKKESLATQKKSSVVETYGGQEHMQAPPPEMLLSQSEHYIEYSEDGKVLKGQEKVRGHWLLGPSWFRCWFWCRVGKLVGSFSMRSPGLPLGLWDSLGSCCSSHTGCSQVQVRGGRAGERAQGDLGLLLGQRQVGLQVLPPGTVTIGFSSVWARMPALAVRSVAWFMAVHCLQRC